MSNQDRRLFYFPPAERLLARTPERKDYDLTLYLDKKVLKYGPLQLHAGIGYAETNTLFSRPFAHSALNGGTSKELRYIKRYTINKLIFPASFNINIGKLYLYLLAIPAIGFRKSIGDNDGEGRRFTKWQFAYNSIEINPGIGFHLLDRMQVSLSYRKFYFHEIDNVIFNSVLFYEPYPEFLQQKVDTHNPFKMWLTVGYRLKK